jgi:hypothetical protein
MTEAEIVTELRELGAEMNEDLREGRNAITADPLYMIEEAEWVRCPDVDADLFWCVECEEQVRPRCEVFPKCPACGQDISGCGTEKARRIKSPGMVALTRSAGDQMLDRQRHNCDEPVSYVESACYSPQMRRLQGLLRALPGRKTTTPGAGSAS